METRVSKNGKEGGWGWVVVFAAFVIYFIVFGSLRCQSVLFVPIMKEYNSDYSTVGWVSATATAGLAISGVIAAWMMAKVGHRVTVMIGGAIACLASITSVFAPTIAVFNITAGLITGLGLGISFVAAPVMIGLYFQKRRAFATNIASMGASIGAFAICPLNGILVDIFTIHGYYLILGGVFLQLAVAGALMRPVTFRSTNKTKSKNNQTPKNNSSGIDEIMIEEINAKSLEPKQSHNDVSKQNNTIGYLFKSIPYLIYCLSQMVFMAGFLTSQLYIVPFAQRELGISRFKAPLVMSIAAGAELLSRIVFGILGDLKQINRLLMFAGVLLALSLCTFFLPFTSSFATLSAAAGVAGLFQGGFSGISVVVLADIVGIQLYGTALGISTLLNGVGTLLAPPLIGIAVNNSDRPSVAIYISAGLLFIGAILTFLIEVAIRFQKRSLREV